MLGLLNFLAAKISGTAGGARGRTVHGKHTIVSAKKPRRSTTKAATYWQTVYAVTEAAWLNLNQEERDHWLRGCPCRGLTGRDYFSRVNIPQVGRYRQWLRTMPAIPHQAAHHEELAGGEDIPGQAADWLPDAVPPPLGPTILAWNTLISWYNLRISVFPVVPRLDYISDGECITAARLGELRIAADALASNFRDVDWSGSGAAWSSTSVKQAAFGRDNWLHPEYMPPQGIKLNEWQELNSVVQLYSWVWGGSVSAFTAEKKYGEKLGGGPGTWDAVWTIAMQRYMAASFAPYTIQNAVGKQGVKTFRGSSGLAAGNYWRTSSVSVPIGSWVWPTVAAKYRVRVGQVDQVVASLAFWDLPGYLGTKDIYTPSPGVTTECFGSPGVTQGETFVGSMKPEPSDVTLGNPYKPPNPSAPPETNIYGESAVLLGLVVKLDFGS